MIVRLSRPVRAEKMRLFCFPYAGGAAHVFRSWSDYVPAEVGLYSIQPPGRGTRFSEPPLRTLDALVSAVLQDLVKFLDLPYILFGHSLGGRVAFAIAERVRGRSLPAPLLLAVSGCSPPNVPAVRDESVMSDEEFYKYLDELGGTPREALANRELISVLTPMLRIDFGMAREVLDPSGLLEHSVLAMGGFDDREVTLLNLEGWRTVTRGPFRLHRFPGGHFFIHEEQAQVVALLLESVRDRLPGLGTQ